MRQKLANMDPTGGLTQAHLIGLIHKKGKCKDRMNHTIIIGATLLTVKILFCSREKEPFSHFFIALKNWKANAAKWASLSLLSLYSLLIISHSWFTISELSCDSLLWKEINNGEGDWVLWCTWCQPFSFRGWDSQSLLS